MNMNKNEKTPISSGEVTNVTRAKKYAGGRFNLVDLCLIILILAAIALILVYLIPGLSSRFQHFDERGIMYTLEFNGVDAAFSANIKSGDAVFNAAKNYRIGTVKSVESASFRVISYNEQTGMAEMKEHPELKTIIITVSADAVYNEGIGYSVNGDRIAVGHTYNVRFLNFSGEATCSALSVVSDSK